MDYKLIKLILTSVIVASILCLRYDVIDTDPWPLGSPKHTSLISDASEDVLTESNK